MREGEEVERRAALELRVCMGGTFQTTARFQDSDSFQKALKMVLRCILSVIFHLLGFRL